VKKKKIPLRLCLVCRLRKEKKSLVRIVKSSSGEIEIDLTGKKPGRGAYVCPSHECITKINRQLLASTFQSEVNEKDVEELKKAIRIITEPLSKEVNNG